MPVTSSLRPSPYPAYRYAPASALKRLVSEARLETRIQSLMLVLERLWLFYEAMRSGKPLAGGDQLLAQMGNALEDPTRTKHSF